MEKDNRVVQCSSDDIVNVIKHFTNDMGFHVVHIEDGEGFYNKNTKLYKVKLDSDDSQEDYFNTIKLLFEKD